MPEIALVIPVLNEERALPELARSIARLSPAPAEIIAIDGGSTDQSRDMIEAAGWRLIATERGRGRQINTGVTAAQAPIVCILHADTALPEDAIAVIDRVMADPRVALAGFTPLICGPEKVRWGFSFHNWIKTWYGPLLVRPHLYFRGVRLLFGDHAMFFRRETFLAVGGCDPEARVMEEADLCIKLARFGRVRLVPRFVRTSDRRIAEWGAWKAHWTYVKVGLLWALGARKRLERHYPDVR